MTLPLAVRIFEVLLGWSLLLQTLEYLRLPSLDRVTLWPILQQEIPARPAWIKASLNTLFLPRPYVALLVLRLFLGIAFIRHGWPKLRNLKTWATAMNTPEWLCFLSAASMWGAGIALIPGLLTPLAALAILVSMAYAMVIEIKAGFPWFAPDPYQIPEGDYVGPMGIGEPPSWEKAAMYVVMCLVTMFCGGGLFSLDNLLIADLLKLALT